MGKKCTQLQILAGPSEISVNNQIVTLCLVKYLLYISFNISFKYCVWEYLTGQKTLFRYTVRQIVSKVGELLMLEGAARYAGLLLAPAEGFGRGLFFVLQAAFYTILAQILVIFGDW